MLELLSWREKTLRRKTDVLDILRFIHGPAWSYMFGKNADDLQQAANVRGERARGGGAAKETVACRKWQAGWQVVGGETFGSAGRTGSGGGGDRQQASHARRMEGGPQGAANARRQGWHQGVRSATRQSATIRDNPQQAANGRGGEC